MAKFDMEAVIRTMVAEEVERSLEPYRELLNGMARLAGGEPPRRRPGRPAARPDGMPAARRAPGRRAARGKVDASRFHEGQLVRYKQGRGEFEAKVVHVDSETNMVTIERTTDKKQVERPADKIYEVA